MATRENVTAAELESVILKGADITDNTRTVIIRESICCPYITAEIQVLDNNNTIVNLKLQGGDVCYVKFNGITGGTYELILLLLESKAENSDENIDLKVYTLSFCTSEYFIDQGVRTPETTEVMQTGCQMVQKIWSEAHFLTPLIQLIQDGPLQDGDQSLTIGLMKPISAIGQVRNIQVYPSHRTGNVLLFRDAKTEQHVPLQFIYQRASGGGEDLVQSQTWGREYRNMFVGGPADRAIIWAVDTSRATRLDPELFQPGDQGRVADDIVKGKMNINDMKDLKGAAMAMMNSNKTSAPIDHTSIMHSARCYAHCLKAQPQYNVRIPIQSGINITVGEAVNLHLTPTTVDGVQELIGRNDGAYLVTDLIHEIHNNLREVLGTTNLQCLKAGGPCGV